MVLCDHVEAFADAGRVRYRRSDVTERMDSIGQWQRPHRVSLFGWSAPVAATAPGTRARPVPRARYMAMPSPRPSIPPVLTPGATARSALPRKRRRKGLQALHAYAHL